MKKLNFKAVFCCAQCLDYVKYQLLDVHQAYAKVCLPCTTSNQRKKKVSTQ